MNWRLLMAVCVVALAGACAPAAGADPTNASGSAVITVVCGTQPVTIVMNGNGIFAPGHDLASTSVLIPTALDVTLTFTFAAGGPPAVDHAIVSKAAPIGDTVNCAIPLQTLFSTPDVSATIAGTVTGFWTPR